MKIVYQSSVNTLVIDQTTARILELIINSSNPKSSDTLFGTINRTKTKSGYILLRANILQVSTGGGGKMLDSTNPIHHNHHHHHHRCC